MNENPQLTPNLEHHEIVPLESRQSNKWVYILRGVALIALGMLMGYYLAQQPKPVVSSIVTTPSTVPSPTISPKVSDEIVEWKKYINEE